MLKRVLAAMGVPVALLLLFAPTADAQDLAQLYRFTPSEGKGSAVRTALQAHSAWRAEQGDPWSWLVFQEVQGPNLGDWIVFSPGHSWADFEAYDQGFGPRGGQHFAATVTPLLESVTSEILRVDEELTNALDDATGYNLFRITNWDLDHARQGQFNQSVARVIQSYPQGGEQYIRTYWDVLIGPNQPRKRSAQWFRDWVDLANAPTPATSLIEEYGQEEAAQILDAFRESVNSSQTYILRVYPDMAVPGSG